MSISVGLDIAKDKIDYYFAGEHGQLANTAEAIKSFFSELECTYRVVMESTGKYHRLPHRILEGLGIEVMVVTPFQSKHFSRALNLLCKTDKVDAKMLSLFGEKMTFKVTSCDTLYQEQLQELFRHRDDMKGIAHGLKMRLKESEGFVAESLSEALATVDKTIKASEIELKQLIAKNEETNDKCNLLCSIPGIGNLTAMVLLCLLKELGCVTKNEVAALAGVAPINNDSGTFTGRRRIQGGRHDVRAHLYMPILGSVTKHNPRLREVYERLVASGKPKKVALTACMRKMIVWANAILTSGEPWNEHHETALGLSRV